MSTSHLYKKFVRVIAKWPLDPTKSHARNLKPLFEKEFERVYKLEAAHTPVDSVHADRQLRALEELVENRHLKDFPHNYKTGIFGTTREQTQLMNSEEMRKLFGWGKGSLLRRIFQFGKKDQS